MFSPAALSGALAILLSATSVAAEVQRGLAWATNDNFAPTIGSKPLVKWYHHWADNVVKQMPSKVEWVPMYWGPKSNAKWGKVKAEMNKKLPKYLLTFNEPELSGQANMSPEYAVDVWMKEVHQWGQKGVKLGSPAIAWDQNWLDKFLKGLAKRGGHVDFICIHWYGSWKDLAGFKKYVQAVHTRFNKDIWIPELGITTASKPTQQQTKNFLMQAYAWMDTLGYVKRAAWFGCFQSNQPPDGYATGKNALFKTGNFLSDMGYYYGYSLNPDRRREIGAGEVERRDLGPETIVKKHARHNRIAAIAARQEEAEDEDDDGTPGVDCDEICAQREASINEYLTATPAARAIVEAE